MHLVFTLCDGRDQRIDPAGDAEQELRDFLDRNGAYTGEWIKLSQDEYVRYDEIVRVRLAR
jgi:hypothetical protein